MLSIICLIIASHNDIYDAFTDLWRENIRLWKEKEAKMNLKYLFVFSDPSLNNSIVCKDDCILCKCEENINGEPGIFLKTMMAIDFIEQNKNDFQYDYILRTNLSSFWNFSVLYEEIDNYKKTETEVLTINTIFLQFLDRNQLFINTKWKDYFEIIDSIFLDKADTFVFIDGAGFLLSHEIINILLLPLDSSIFSKILLLPDDIAISILLYCNCHFSNKYLKMEELLIYKKIICNNGDFNVIDRNIDIGFIRNKQSNGDRNLDIYNFKNEIDFFIKN